MEKQILHLAEKFFSKLQIKIDSIEIVKQVDNIYLIKIQTPDSGLIIGNHGKNLKDFETLLGLLATKKFGEKIKIHLEVNDYLDNKEKKLFSFIDSKIKIVQETGKDIRLPFFTSYERKKIHSYIANLNLKDIYTKSSGEGKNRRLYICKKNEKVTIDLDGTDI